MNKELEQHLTSIRNVLVGKLPRQCREGIVNPSEWTDLQLAADWLTDNNFSLSKDEASGFNDLLLWVESAINEMIDWMRG